MNKNCCKNNSIAHNSIKKLKKNFDVLNDENRLRILCLLKKHKILCVCEIQKELNLPQNLVSYHLNKLKTDGFLESKKEGVKVSYSLEKKKIKNFSKLINLII